MPSNTARIQIATRQNLFPVELLDHQFRRVKRAYGRLEATVPPGIYLARCEIGGPAVERLVKVAADQAVSIEFDETETGLFPSAAPVPGSVSRHEFYTEPSAALATKKPPHASLGSGARLVLFATQLDFAIKPDWQHGAKPVHWGGVKLRGRRGRVLAALPGEEIRDDNDRFRGLAGFCADLDPGGYYLEWPSPQAEEGRVALQPLWIASGWSTLFFAGAAGESPTPRRDTVSIHMVRLGSEPPPYEPEADRVNAAAELALASLRTGRRQLSDDQVGMLLNAKFNNPMLGLLGAHMMLERSKPNRDLLKIVCHNLRDLLGNHPDLTAIELLAERHCGLTPNTPLPTEHAFPPMLRDGLLTLDRARWEPGSKIQLTGTARLARLRLLGEAPWTIFWHPVVAAAKYVSAEAVRKDFVERILDSPRLYMHAESLPAPEAESVAHLTSEGSPFAAAEAEAEAAARHELSVYLQGLTSRGGLKALQSLGAENLGWTGLAPAEAQQALDAVVHVAAGRTSGGQQLSAT